MKKILFIDKKILDKYNHMMSLEHINYEKHGISRYSTVTSWTADFGNGYEIDLKVCSSNNNDPLWCEAVLFLHGSECCCTEVCDTLDGEWLFEHHGNQFTLIVKAQ